MRISDWSSDVCSSDLAGHLSRPRQDWLSIAGSECRPMGFYHDRILPCLIHLTMRQQNLVPYRQRVISAAEGRILEVGVRSEERRVGKECVNTCRSRWSTNH